MVPAPPPDSPAEALAGLRARIDALDDDLLRLLNERARLVEEVGRCKAALGVEGAFYVPGRERTIVARLQARNPGPFPTPALGHVFQKIFSACLSLEKGLRVAYLGPEGTFSHLAVRQRFGKSARALPAGTIAAVLDRVARGEADLGVVPVENSTEGLVGSTLDALLEAPPRITGELVVDVEHALLARPGSSLDEISRVHSHPQALGQCRAWLEEHLPQALLLEAPSTAEAARLALEEPGGAAIASELAAELHGLSVLRRRIQDQALNQTRFWVVGGPEPGPSGADRTSLLVPGGDGPGVLYRLLTPLAERGLNLTRIESRPARRRPWEFVFFLELEGHASDGPVAEALAQLRSVSPALRLLGSYPRARAKGKSPC